MELLNEFIREFKDDQYPCDMLEQFELLECLAHNEQSETLLARNHATGEMAVIKCYPKNDKTYCQEAMLLGRLNNPGIPRLLGEYSSPTLYCVARAYIKGQPLSAPGLREALSREDVLDIGAKLCDILTDLHTQEPPIIHRDIKPQNIILSDDGKVSLIDFGISRAYKPKAEKDTVSFGTQSFAPPEQYGFRQTDCRSDIYSLGAVLMYLLCGAVQPERIDELIADKELARVVSRCMAFSPQERFGSAADVRKALLAETPSGKRNARKKAIRLSVVCAALLCIVAFVMLKWVIPSLCAPAAYAFSEPLIEQEVRLVLGLSEEEPLTADALASVGGLYIIGDECCTDVDGYYQALERWYQAEQPHGTIATLEDLKQMPNIRELCVGMQRITDISPLSGLSGLERVELRGNSIQGITPLAEHLALSNIGLNANPVKDLSPLATCPQVRILDLCDASYYDPSIFEAFTSLDFLDISNRTDTYKVLGGKAIRELKLAHTSIDSLGWLAEVSGLRSLEINGTPIVSLDGIEAHQSLETVNISGLRIRDYTPLLKLPNLKTVIVSPDMASAIEGVAAQGGFQLEIR